jgi:hypothetical protein
MYFFQSINQGLSLTQHTEQRSEKSVLGYASLTLRMTMCQTSVCLLLTVTETLFSTDYNWRGHAVPHTLSSNIPPSQTHKSCEGQLADQQLSWLLVLSNLSQSYGARPVPVWLSWKGGWRTERDTQTHMRLFWKEALTDRKAASINAEQSKEHKNVSMPMMSNFVRY